MIVIMSLIQVNKKNKDPEKEQKLINIKNELPL